MSGSRKRPARSVLLAATAVAALALSACASDSPAGDGETGAGGGGGTDTITVIHAPINYETVYIAQQEGFFEEEGLTVTITPGGTAQDNLAQVVGGSADITTLAWDGLAQASLSGIPVIAVAGNGVVSSEFATSGVVVRADSGIESIADLEGRTLGVNGLNSAGDVPISQEAESEGIDPESVTKVAVPYPSMLESLRTGAVDAIAPADSFYQQALADDTMTVIANPVREWRAGLPITLWSSTDSWLEQNAGTAERFGAAMEKAVAFYMDPANEETVLEIRSEVSGQPIDAVSRVFTPMSVAINLDVGQEVLDAIHEFGFLGEPVEAADLVWSGVPTTTDIP